jgi:type IV secretion system protein VirD4
MISRLGLFLCRIMLVLACFLTACGMALLVLRFPFAFLLALAFCAWRRFRNGGGSSWTHGTATVASLTDMARGGLLADTGLILGRVIAEEPSRWQAMAGLLSPGLGSDMACRQFLGAFFGLGGAGNRMIRVQDFVHLAVFARTGAGKGVSVVIPNLLSYGKSVVAIDVKGELFKLTARHRQKRLGQTVIRVDPLGIAGPAETSDTFNPLDAIDETAADFLDQCRDVAHQLVVRTGKEHDQHWLDSAQRVITAMIAFVCAYSADRSLRNLRTVRQLVGSRAKYEQAVEVMQQLDAFGGILREQGGALTWFEGKELGSVLTTVQRMLEFLDSPAIARNVETSSFDPRILRSGRATIYLILPSDKLASLAPLQRLWIGPIMRASTHGADERNPVLWLLDEVAHIGSIKVLEEAVTLYRGMGTRLFFFFQSLGQMKACFGEGAETILDNIGTQMYFGIKSYESAEAVSKQIGEATISTTSYNWNRSRSRSVGGTGANASPPVNISEGTSSTRSDMARRVFKPEEILTMGEETALILHRNLPVAVARLLKYYEAPEFRRGGTGKPRRLNPLAAGIAAAFALLVSCVLTTGAVLLAEGPALPPAAWHSQAAPPAHPPVINFRANGRTYAIRPGQRSRKPTYGMPGRSGYLIEIK